MKLFFDIGCCNGKWIDANYQEDIMFIGIEPHKVQYAECVERFADKKNVKMVNLLVANRVGEFDFYPFDQISTVSNDWMTKSRHRHTEYPPPYKVQSTTLDLIIAQFGIPDYIKIDVEGFEYEVLKGLTQKVGMIAFEFVEEIDTMVWDCMKYLHDLGYNEFDWTHWDQYNYRPEKWKSYQEQVDEFKGIFRVGREQCWGMIYAK